MRQQVADYKQFMADIQQIMGHNNFEVILLRDRAKIFTNENIQNIKSENLGVKSCIAMKGRSSKLFSYLVSLAQDTKLNEVR